MGVGNSDVCNVADVNYVRRVRAARKIYGKSCGLGNIRRLENDKTVLCERFTADEKLCLVVNDNVKIIRKSSPSERCGRFVPRGNNAYLKMRAGVERSI